MTTTRLWLYSSVNTNAWHIIAPNKYPLDEGMGAKKKSEPHSFAPKLACLEISTGQSSFLPRRLPLAVALKDPGRALGLVPRGTSDPPPHPTCSPLGSLSESGLH